MMQGIEITRQSDLIPLIKNQRADLSGAASTRLGTACLTIIRRADLNIIPRATPGGGLPRLVSMPPAPTPFRVSEGLKKCA